MVAATMSATEQGQPKRGRGRALGESHPWSKDAVLRVLADRYADLPADRYPNIPLRDWSVIERRRSGMTLCAIAAQEGVTPERVRQIEERVLWRVRQWRRTNKGT